MLSSLLFFSSSLLCWGCLVLVGDFFFFFFLFLISSLAAAEDDVVVSPSDLLSGTLEDDEPERFALRLDPSLAEVSPQGDEEELLASFLLLVEDLAAAFPDARDFPLFLTPSPRLLPASWLPLVQK